MKNIMLIMHLTVVLVLANARSWDIAPESVIGRWNGFVPDRWKEMTSEKMAGPGWGISIKKYLGNKYEIIGNFRELAQICFFCDYAPSNSLLSSGLGFGRVFWQKYTYISGGLNLSAVIREGPGNEMVHEPICSQYSCDPGLNNTIWKIDPAIGMYSSLGVRYGWIGMGIGGDFMYTSFGLIPCASLHLDFFIH